MHYTKVELETSKREAELRMVGELEAAIANLKRMASRPDLSSPMLRNLLQIAQKGAGNAFAAEAVCALRASGTSDWCFGEVDELAANFDILMKDIELRLPSVAIEASAGMDYVARSGR